MALKHELFSFPQGEPYTAEYFNSYNTISCLLRNLFCLQIFQTKQALLVIVVVVGLEWTAWFEVVAAEASPAVSAALAVVFADSGVAAGSSAACLAAF